MLGRVLAPGNDGHGQQATVTYDGTVEKNTMKGSANIAGMLNGTFTGTKK